MTSEQNLTMTQERKWTLIKDGGGLFFLPPNSVKHLLSLNNKNGTLLF